MSATATSSDRKQAANATAAAVDTPFDEEFIRQIEDLVLPPPLLDRYYRETWQGRRNELIGWCLTVALLNAGCMTLDLLTLTAPTLQWIAGGRVVIISVLLIAVRCLRSSWAFDREGPIVIGSALAVMAVAGVCASVAAPHLLERLLTNGIFVGSTVLILARIRFRHTLAGGWVGLALIVGFTAHSEALSLVEKLQFVAFYGIGACALVHARHVQNRIQFRLFVLSLSERIKVAKVSELNAKLHGMARTDPLTAIGNRRFFDETFAALADRGPAVEPLAVFMIDIDHFKKLNDVFGHGRGDDCLRAVAAALRDGLRGEADVVARFGGEEFVVVLPIASLEDGATIADRLRQRVYDLDLPHPASPSRRVTVSIGVAATPHVPLDQLVRRADEALYDAKQLGRDRVFVFETVAWDEPAASAA